MLRIAVVTVLVSYAAGLVAPVAATVISSVMAWISITSQLLELF